MTQRLGKRERFAKVSITHLGGEHCVTGSCHLLQTNGLQILVDCGSVQGNDTAVPMKEWPVSPADIDYLFLTHAHIDHIGRVPELIRGGFRGEIITSHATKALMGPMLRDAMALTDVHEKDIKTLQGLIDDLSWGFENDREFDVKKGLRFQLGRAGHILGSCFIRFSSGNPQWSVVFSGDLGAKDTPILCDPETPGPADLVVLESTYGDRLHEGRKLRAEQLGRILLHVLGDGGKVYIPAFALGRTQELLYEMDRIFANQTNHVPVFVDTPLGLEITEIYSQLSEYWDKEARDLLHHGNDPIDFNNLYAVHRFKEHQSLIDFPGPAVIIAGSGMCTGGRIIDHLVSGLEESANDILFVAYQGRGTPGRDILRYGKYPHGYVRLDGRRVNIRAAVHSMPGYSAHADQRGLLEWVQSIPEKPKQIKLVHGEPKPQQVLAERLKELGYNVLPVIDTKG